MHYIQITEHGGPEQLIWRSAPKRELKPHEIRVHMLYSGVNFIDTYQRSGLYPIELPSGLGVEGVGEVIECGEDVTSFSNGQKVAICMAPMGTYSEELIVDAAAVLSIPQDVEAERIAASLLKGLTASYLLQQTAQIKEGMTILVHAAAGGVGQILVQWAKHLGAQVIGTVGSQEKADVAQKLGCDQVILYREENIVENVMAYTDGRGADVVYDSVGADTFQASLEACRTRGLVVSYGNASGPAPALSPLELTKHGSLFLTRPTLAHYMDTPEAKTELVKSYLEILPKLKLSWSSYPMNEAAQAHRDLEARKTMGSLILKA